MNGKDSQGTVNKFKNKLDKHLIKSACLEFLDVGNKSNNAYNRTLDKPSASLSRAIPGPQHNWD